MSSNAVVARPLKTAPGYKFHPTNAVVINRYLRPKNLGMNFELSHAIDEVDFYNWEPWELASKPKQLDDSVWGFFHKRDYKYPKSTKLYNRKTKAGSWKSTRRASKIEGPNGIIGFKRIFVFLKGPTAATAKKTPWVMHEYAEPEPEPHNALSHQKAFVFCLLKKKDEKGQNAYIPNLDEGEQSGELTSDVETPVALVATPEVGIINAPNLGEGEPSGELNTDVETLVAPSANREVGIISAPNLGEGEPSGKLTFVAPAATLEVGISNAPDLGEGEPSGKITSDAETLVAPAATPNVGISNAPDLGEGEPSGELTSDAETLVTPAATPEVGISNAPNLGEGEPIGELNSDVETLVAPVATPEVHGHESLWQPLYSPDCRFMEQQVYPWPLYFYNEKQTSWGADESEEDFVNSVIVDPEENNYGETTDNLFNESSLQASLKRKRVPDETANYHTDLEGGDERVNRYRPLPTGDSLQ